MVHWLRPGLEDAVNGSDYTLAGWNDRHGKAIYQAIAAGQDPFDLGIIRSLVSWYIIWLAHAKEVVIQPDGGLREWLLEVDDLVAA